MRSEGHDRAETLVNAHRLCIEPTRNGSSKYSVTDGGGAHVALFPTPGELRQLRAAGGGEVTVCSDSSTGSG